MEHGYRCGTNGGQDTSTSVPGETALSLARSGYFDVGVLEADRD